MKNEKNEAVAAMVNEFNLAVDDRDVQEALQKIQLELKSPKNLRNDFAHFVYRNASGILEAVKPILNKVGCTIHVSDSLLNIGNRFYIKSTVTLQHIASGTKVMSEGFAREDEFEKGKCGAQITGSASTYAKKYALCNLFAIDDSSDDPDTKDNSENVDAQIRDAISAFSSATTIDNLKSLKVQYANLLDVPSVKTAAIVAYNRLSKNDEDVPLKA